MYVYWNKKERWQYDEVKTTTIQAKKSMENTKKYSLIELECMEIKMFFSM